MTGSCGGSAPPREIVDELRILLRDGVGLRSFDDAFEILRSRARGLCERTVRHRIRTVALVVGGLAASPAGGGSATAQDLQLDGGFPEVYRAGGIDAPAWAHFDNLTQMAFDASGSLYVLDRNAFEIVVIDRQGRLVATIGRRGEGPGEFLVPTDLVVWRDGRFVVVDAMRGAYQLFGMDGTLERYVRMSATPGAAGIAAARQTIRGDPLGDALIAEGPGGMATTVGLIAEEVGGAQVDIAGEFGKLERVDLSGDVAVVELIARTRPTPREDAAGNRPYFAPEVIWDVLPNGTIGYVDSTTYAIHLISRDGRQERVLERSLYPEVVTSKTRAAVIGHFISEMEQRTAELSRELPGVGVVPQDAIAHAQKRARDGIRRREFFPEIRVLRGLRATWEGALWVRRRGEEPWDNHGPIDVWGLGGEYQGTFAAGALMPMAFGPEGLVAYLEKDEIGLWTIVVKKLPAKVR